MGLSQGRLIVGALAVIAVVSIVLWIPVLGDRFTAFLSRTGPKAAPKIILIGGGLIAGGMMTGVRLLEVIGGCLIGALALAWLYDQY